MNHRKSGMERIYDAYELEDEKAAWFLKWENEIVAIARKAGIAARLGIPGAVADEAGQVAVPPLSALRWPVSVET